MIPFSQLMQSWTECDPNHVAVEGPGERLTYAQLDGLANRFAHLLLRTGVKSGDRVGIHLPRSGRAIAAMLGTLRAGAAYVPLDPGSPAARISLIAQDCGLRHVVISPQRLTNWLTAEATPRVEHFFLSQDGPEPSPPSQCQVHAWSELLVQPSVAPPPVPEDPDALAYVLYTSGSTGIPKGVMISHRNANAFIEWAAQQIELSHADRVASVAPFHFDLSVFDVWASLWRGATLVIVDETTVMSGPRMLARIRSQEITVWYSVPSAWVLMLEQTDLEIHGAPSLRAVYFAGEVFPIKHLRRAMAALPNAAFFNLFGPTETNVCLAYALSKTPGPEETAIPVGYPACGDIVSVLDPNGSPVSDGEIGELFVDGPTVMLGYWNGGDRLLAPHPYPTGDLVSKRSVDGALMYHGRRDHLVKVHGHRIELGEVEAAVQAHLGVQEAIVLVLDQELWSVVVTRDPNLSVLGLKQHCARRLPRYMIPTAFVLVDALPRTSNGKIDRVKLKTDLTDGSLRPKRKETEWKRA